ncbi:MAG: T9SS type A sorting domain-containing protein [Saprospiraceae bacterium]|nr:T9SS type A sorting domain-containing protein [Saprospiraceae bacterium]
MKHGLIYSAVPLLFGFFIFLSSQKMVGQNPILVKDINPGPIGSATDNHPHLQIDDVIYFVGDILGKRDLYSIKNGNIEFITQICSSSCNLHEIYFLEFQKKLFFIKRFDNNVIQIWSTNGTMSGTTMIMEYKGFFKNFVVGNNNKMYLGLTNGTNYKDETYISDGSTTGTYKLHTNVRLGSINEAFGAPIKYGNGIAFANITNDTLKLFTYNDENLNLINAIKVDSESSITGLKSINGDNIVTLIHSDKALSSSLYRYDYANKKISKELSLPFTRQEYPYLKDYKKDSLILFYHTGGHFLLTTNPLQISNITNYSDASFNLSKMYYTNENNVVYLTKDDKATINMESKLVVFSGAPDQIKVFEVVDSNTPSLIGHGNYAFYGTDDPIFKSGTITMIDLINFSKKQVFSFNQTFSSNQLNLLGLLGTKLYFFANLDQTYGKELYYVETGIPSSLKTPTEGTKYNYKVICNGNYFKILSDTELIHPLNVQIFDISGRLVTNKKVHLNTEFYVGELSKGIYFIQMIDHNNNFINTLPIIIP